ncbi:MAG: histidine--tRNA ligase [Clostridia bacterium]|nr:histidine--tRNA ligase [Clostridia bacterium]
MAMNTNPARGMRDFLPEDKALREYVKSTIRKVYETSGFTEIETPAVENIENLLGSDGGENLKLIYKILKRGEKLDLDQSGLNESDLADLGLRYDLTIPLCRYYANNKANLPGVFKAIQIGNVYRAERSQKGRYRTFVQCDVDVIGDTSITTEIDLINTVTKALTALSLNNFVVRINDRRVLKGAIAFAGFSDDEFPKVCIILDKMDKIGEDGVKNELLKESYDEANIDKLMDVLKVVSSDNIEALKNYGVEEAAVESLSTIISAVKMLSGGAYDIEFDFTLVRGMGYYTGTIFEIAMSDLGYSVAGGGRYDELIGRFIGESVPACGFSIGFERIVDLLKERNFKPNQRDKVALVYDESTAINVVMSTAEQLRTEGSIVSILQKAKKFGKQLNRFEAEGYNKVAILNNDALELKNLLEE